MNNCIIIVMLMSVTPSLFSNITIYCPKPIDLGCNPEMPRSIPDPDIRLVKVKSDCKGEVIVHHMGDDLIVDGCTYILTRTYRATDRCHQSETCFQTITWRMDENPPRGVCPGDVFLGCNPELPLKLPKPSLQPTDFADDCGKVTVDVKDGDITVFGCRYSFTRTYLITDLCGNVQRCFQQISWIVDEDPPEVIAGPKDWDLGCNPSHIPPPDPGLFEVKDCSRYQVKHLEDKKTISKCEQKITRYYLIVDACGNETKYHHVICWKIDVTAPTIICPDTLDLGCNPNTIPTPDPSIVKAVDACGIAQIHMIASSIVFDPVWCRYTIHRTYEAIDHCGNKSTCDHTITWKENTQIPDIINCPADSFLGYDIDPLTDLPPVAGQPLLVQAYCSWPTTWTELGSVYSDDCLSWVTRTYYITDDCGNENSCDQTYYWINQQNGSLAVPSNISLDCNEDVSNYWPTYMPGDTIDSIPCAGIYLIFSHPDLDPLLNITTCLGTINFHYVISGPTFSIPYTQHMEWALTIPQAGCPCIDDIVFPGFSSENNVVLSNTESGSEPSWSVYPNPAVDVIQVVNKVPDVSNFNLRIVDISGKVISQFIDIAGDESQHSIDISDLSPGVYMVTRQYGGTIESQRFIKH